MRKKKSIKVSETIFETADSGDRTPSMHTHKHAQVDMEITHTFACIRWFSFFVYLFTPALRTNTIFFPSLKVLHPCATLPIGGQDVLERLLTVAPCSLGCSWEWSWAPGCGSPQWCRCRCTELGTRWHGGRTGHHTGAVPTSMPYSLSWAWLVHSFVNSVNCLSLRDFFPFKKPLLLLQKSLRWTQGTHNVWEKDYVWRMGKKKV